jgi:8-oxo-dGTP pyrophosphatase MutT (NUDIX family)
MIKQLSTKTVYKNPWMTVREDQVEFSNGHQGIYGVVEKDHFALIVPFDGRHFHLVKQYRYSTGVDSIEFPQGKHEDATAMSPIDLANAELEEEIGLRTKKIEEIGFFYEAPGYSNQGFHLFLATDLYEGQAKPDMTESDLVHVTMTVEEFEQAIIKGEITDAPTISAYGLLKVKKVI